MKYLWLIFPVELKEIVTKTKEFEGYYGLYNMCYLYKDHNRVSAVGTKVVSGKPPKIHQGSVANVQHPTGLMEKMVRPLYSTKTVVSTKMVVYCNLIKGT